MNVKDWHKEVDRFADAPLYSYYLDGFCGSPMRKNIHNGEDVTAVVYYVAYAMGVADRSGAKPRLHGPAHDLVGRLKKLP